MRCTEALERIDLSLTGDLGTIATLRLRHHVYGCRSCYAELRRARQVHGVLDDYVTHLRPATGLRDRVLSDIATTPSPITAAFAPERARRPWIAPLVAAAAVLVAGFALWAVLSNRAATDEILARVTRIEGRARYTAPGERASVPLSVDDVVVSDGRVESPDDDASSVETDGGAAHYDVGPGGAFRLRRGDRGAIVVYERGSVGISTRRAGIVAEVRTPGGVVVPQDDAMTLAIAPFPARDNAHRIELRRGRVEVRNPDGTLALDAPNAAIVAAGFAPEPWSEPAPPLPQPKPPAAAVTAVGPPKPRPHVKTAAEVVDDLQKAAAAISMFAREHDEEVMPRGSDPTTIRRTARLRDLVDRYEAARKAVIELGPASVVRIFRCQSMYENADGPLAECVEAIVASVSKSSAEEDVLDWIITDGTRHSWDDGLWLGRTALFRLPRTLSNLCSVSWYRRWDPCRAAIFLEPVFSNEVVDRRLAPSDDFRRRITEAYLEPTTVRGHRLSILRLFAAIGASRELRDLESREADPELRARIHTYLRVDANGAAAWNGDPKGIVRNWSSSPWSVESEGLDGATIVELLLRSVWKNRSTPTEDWVRVLEDAYLDRAGVLGREPSDLLRRAAAVALARWMAISSDDARIEAILAGAEGANAPRQSFNVAFFQALEDLGREPGQLALRSPTLRRLVSAGWAACRGTSDPLTVGDVAWAILERASTSAQARRLGEWHSLSR